MSVLPLKNASYRQWLLLLIVGTLALRWALMIASPLNLHGDEAQYWAWSRDLDWGYFSKPPLIAWVIALFTSIFGSAEWAIRLPSALLHSLTCWVIFVTVRKAFDARTGFWAACFYLFMPGVWLSSTIISTDVPLLLCWALALNAWVYFRDAPSWPRALQLGLAIGFGLLAKYAMLFFLPILGFAVLIDGRTRRALLGPKGLAAGAVAAALFIPNIIWNLNHDFATLAHTAENANLSGPLLNPFELLSFWGSQLGVFGPIAFPVLILALFKWKQLPVFGRWIAGLALLPLLVISLEALLSRANANWAATAYIAAPIIVALYAVSRPKLMTALKIGLIAQSAVMIVAGIAMTVPVWANAIGLANSVKRSRGWPETIQAIEDIYNQGHDGKTFGGVATDNRLVFYDALYYGLTDTAPLSMWKLSPAPGNHAEMTRPLTRTENPVLLITYYEDEDELYYEDFEKLIPLDPIDIDLGGGKRRQLNVWAGYGYTPPSIARSR